MNFEDERYPGERADAERGDWQDERDTLDRKAEYAPAPADPFIDAASRGKAIFAAGDSIGSLARAIGTDNATLLRLGDAFHRNRERGYDGTGIPTAALPMAITADALLLGVLIGRELGRP